MGLAGCRSMTSREDVAQSAERWQAHCRKTDTPSETALRQLQANTPGGFQSLNMLKSESAPPQAPPKYALCMSCNAVEHCLYSDRGNETAFWQPVSFV